MSKLGSRGGQTRGVKLCANNTVAIHYQGAEGVFELTWAPDGRALFRRGDPVRPGEPHIVWLRIGTHDILDEE